MPAAAGGEPLRLGDSLAWLHRPQGAAHDTGIVLCPPFGYEALCAHRSLRLLAMMLADAGGTVLRLSYPGTGDAGGEDAPGRLQDWAASIHEAAQWLRQTAGMQQVVLCGVRLGGLLAALAAAGEPGALGLALLLPVQQGRQHARELRLRNTAPTGDPWLEVAGFRLHQQDLAALQALQLDSLLRQASPPRLLLLQPARDFLPAASLAALPQARQQDFPGHAAMLRHAHEASPPLASFSALVDWIGAAARPASPPACRVPPALQLLPCGGAETALRFGPNRGLAGVLAQPAPWRAAPGVPALLILNNGLNPCSGNGRGGTRLARRLCRLGVASLRFDAHGIGDSDDPPAPPDHAVPGFATTTVADVSAALDVLQRQGHGGAVVVGHCAGADLGLRSAVADARIRGLVLANLPAFDRTAGGAAALDGGPPEGEVAWLRRPRLLWRRLRAKADAGLARLGLDSGLDPAGQRVRQLRARGASLLLVYSQGDRGLRELHAHFGLHGRALRRWPGLRCVVLAGRDHAFNPLGMQLDLLALVEEELRRHHGLGDRPLAGCTTPPAPTRVARLLPAELAPHAG